MKIQLRPMGGRRHRLATWLRQPDNKYAQLTSSTPILLVIFGFPPGILILNSWPRMPTRAHSLPFLDYLRVERGSAKFDDCRLQQRPGAVRRVSGEAPHRSERSAAGRCARIHSGTVLEFTGRPLGGTEAFGDPATLPAFAAGWKDRQRIRRSTSICRSSGRCCRRR